jgi:starch-binding outer membrane protein, SusD/RagB family
MHPDVLHLLEDLDLLHLFPTKYHQAACFAAILYERQIELAYEGKRFDDLRRWMLFDGGAERAEGAPDTWVPSGWNGNTCTYLGFKQLNGQRRDNLEFRVSSNHESKGLGGTSWEINGVNPDPLKDVTRPDALDLRQADISSQQNKLVEFYNTYLTRKMKKGDAYTTDHTPKYMNFLPRYYFLGFAERTRSTIIQICDSYHFTSTTTETVHTTTFSTWE